MVSVSTRVGGRTSSNSSAWLSRANDGQGPEQPGPEAPVEGEHRAGQLGPALHVEEAELGADLPVGHPLGVAVGRATVRPGPEHHVVLGAAAVGGVGEPGGWGGTAGPGAPPPGRLGHRVERPAPRRPTAGSRSVSSSARRRRPAWRASPTCLESAFTSARSSSRWPTAARAAWSSSASRSTSARVDPRRAEGGLHRGDVVSAPAGYRS